MNELVALSMRLTVQRYKKELEPYLAFSSKMMGELEEIAKF